MHTFSTTIPPLTQAPDEIKLAVDIIYLLESHHIPPKLALAALKIVENDLLHKINQNSNNNE